MTSFCYLSSITMVSLLLLGVVDAFCSFTHSQQENFRLQNKSQLYESSWSDDGGVEKARQLLSQAWASEEEQEGDQNHLSAKKLVRLMIYSQNKSDFDDQLPPPPPLTTMERDRRMAELKLLEQLASSDDATSELVELWASEKGPQAKERLGHAEEMLEKGQVIAAEMMLMKLIDDFGVHWVEPLNRLATVYFHQGRFEDSYAICEKVLHMKPWHFGASEAIVTASMRLSDRDSARSWAIKGLPKLFSSTSFPPFATTGALNPQRAQWVEGALQQAQEAFAHLEYVTQRDFMGTPEDYYQPVGASPAKLQESKVEEDSDAEWQ